MTDPKPAARVETQTWAGIRMVPAVATHEAREAARKTDFYQHGDMVLMWVNEGDLMPADMATHRLTPSAGMVERALLEIVAAVREYLPPGGDPATLISRVIAAVDNPEINPVIASLEART